MVVPFSLYIYTHTHILFKRLLGGSKIPSEAFCLLLRLLTLRCTEKQMTLLLDHVDSPYIRGMGFLYLRYTCPPEQVWKWIQPYLYDEEPISIKANALKTSNANNNDTIGSFVRFVFNTRSYHGTTFPRWPSQIERDIQVNLLQAEKVDLRAKQHFGNRERMSYFQKLGSKVRALYGDDENPIEWYDGVVDRVITRDDETNQSLKYPKFVVTFPEYGNTEIVTLGEMDMPDGGSSNIKTSSSSGGRGDDWRRNQGGGGRSDYNNGNRAYRGRDYDNRGDRYGERDRGRGYGNRDYRDSGRGGGNNNDDRWERGGRGGGSSKNDLYEEVRRRERETVTTNSRNGAARRPPSTKSVMASSSSSDRHRHYDEGRHRSRSPPPSPPRGGGASDSRSNSNTPPPSTSPPPKKRSAEELAAIRAKKQKLLAKYG